MKQFGQLVSNINTQTEVFLHQLLPKVQVFFSIFLFSLIFSLKKSAEIGKYQAMLIFFTGFAIMGVSLENISIGYVLSYVQCDLQVLTLIYSIKYICIIITAL